VHTALPSVFLKVSAMQAEHGPPFGPVYPALQVQSTAASLALGEVEYPGHTRQVAAAVAPVEVEYVPAPHGVHVALPVLILY
jgi:hypothetical protein